MKQGVVNGFFKEFPFLQGLIPADFWPDSIKVARISEHTLNLKNSRYYHTGSMGSTENTAEFYAVYDSGVEKIITQAEETCKSNYSYDGEHHTEGAPIIEGVRDDVRYIVQIWTRFSDWSGQNRTNEEGIIIYKAPKGATVAEMIARDKFLCEQEVKRASNIAL